MKRPSAQALDLADEILDHVRHGLTRADALYELADLIDDHNAELLRAIRRLLGDAAHGGGSPGRDTLADLEAVARDYQPLRPADDVQADLFALQGASPRLF
jgi:hypothetical protein